MDKILPVISQFDTVGAESSRNDRKTIFSTVNLPRLNNHKRNQNHNELIVRSRSENLLESGVVVHNKKQPSSMIPSDDNAKEVAALSNAEVGLLWSSQRLESNGPSHSIIVNNKESGGENSEVAARDKVQWENEIARHILSLYATTKALRTNKDQQNFGELKQAEALLEYVAPRKNKSKNSVGPAPLDGEKEEKILTKVPQFSKNTKEKDKVDTTLNRTVKEGHQEKIETVANKNLEQNFENENNNLLIKKRAQRRGRKSKRSGEEYQADIEIKAKVRQQEDADIKLIEDLIARIEIQANIRLDEDKYRVNNTITTRSGESIIVRGSPRCFPIWFAGGGDIFADWTILPGGGKLQRHLSVLYENFHYKDYLQVLEVVIIRLWREMVFGLEEYSVGSFGLSGEPHFTAANASMKKTSQKGSKQHLSTQAASNKKDRKSEANNYEWYDKVLEDRVSSPVRRQVRERIQYLQEEREKVDMAETYTTSAEYKQTNQQQLTLAQLQGSWRQLIMTCIAIATICIEKSEFENAMDFLNTADRWSNEDQILPSRSARIECKGYIKDGMAFYFFKKQRAQAAIGYAQQALDIFEKLKNSEGVGACLLHISAVHVQTSHFKEAHRVIFDFLAMIETGRLGGDENNNTPRQLCLVAVGYHNLAVIQLKLGMPDLACKSIQNARRIARLCLAHSNRWISNFDYTYELALHDMRYELLEKNINQLTAHQLAVVRELSADLFCDSMRGG